MQNERNNCLKRRKLRQNNMLTLKDLKELEPSTIFAKGTTLVEDYWDTSKEMQIDWVAVRGGIYDWAIYYQLTHLQWDEYQIKDNGEKMHNEKSIKKCVPCDDEAFKMYRY